MPTKAPKAPEAYKAEPIGFQEMAALLGVKPTTVRMWKWKGLLPEEDYIVHGMETFERATVIIWAGQTGRIRDDALAKEYRALTGKDPNPPRMGGPVLEDDA